MNRPEFLTSPGSWIRTRRIAQSAAEYASAIERPTRRDITAAVAGWLVAIVVGILLALLLVHYLTPCEAGALCAAPFARCKNDACRQGRDKCPTPAECIDYEDGTQIRTGAILVALSALGVLAVVVAVAVL